MLRWLPSLTWMGTLIGAAAGMYGSKYILGFSLVKDLEAETKNWLGVNWLKSFYPLVAQKTHYFRWGYTGLQDKIIETGKELLAWGCRYAASMNRRETK